MCNDRDIRKKRKRTTRKWQTLMLRLSKLVCVVPFCHAGEMICICKGQIYEKKSKKGTRDLPEEHTRYINLISTLGPEMSQEK
jgi:hypothetical protein